MTDKIKLKADKFVNDKKLKLNYIKPKDLKLLLAEFCEEQIAELKAECDLAIEGRDVKIKELETRCNELFLQTCEQAEKIKELEAQIEKLIDFVLSKTECCDVCPITDTCINSEGTCPYAGILAKGEEEVTREWLMQFISKEIKEK